MSHRLFVFITYTLTAAALIFQLSCGSGGSSNAAPTGVTIVSAPISVAAVAGDGMVTLTWTSVANAISYKLYRASQSGVSKSNYAVLTNEVTSPYQLSGLANDLTYYFVITSVNSAGESDDSTEVSAKPVSGALLLVTISGKIQYQDKEYGLNGFTGQMAYKPVRYADLEVVGTTTTGRTGADGTYSLSVFSSTSSTVYVRVATLATFSNTPAIEVKDLSGNLYGVPGGDFMPSGDSVVNIAIPAANPAGGAFNMLDVFTSGFDFVHSLDNSDYPPLLHAYWQTGNQVGTWFCVGYDPSYCPQGDGIYVLGGNSDGSGDTDQYDDDVLLHEFGHFTADKFSHDDSPGGAHRLSDNDLDLRLSWSEGWGDFFPGAVKSWLDPALLSSTGVPLTGYIDTFGTGAGIAFDMGNPGGSSFIYSSNEVAVAKILIDLRAAFSMQSVWNVITDFKAAPPSTPVNLELFWDRWHSTGESPAIGSFFAERSIQYALDSFEPDDVMTSASTYTQPQVKHTLYSGGDVDHVAFDAIAGRQYTVTTTNLKNGADTYLELYSSPGQINPVAVNDDASTSSLSSLCDSYDVCHVNGYDILGSAISFAASATGTYYVKIYSSPFRPVSAGRYGSYTLTIASP